MLYTIPVLVKRQYPPTNHPQALQSGRAGCVDAPLAAQALVVCVAIGPAAAACQLWAALVADPRFSPTELLAQAAAELVALSSVDANAAVLRWLAHADEVSPTQAAAFAWDIIQALMAAQQVSAAVQACSAAHDAAVLACYELPVHVPRITAACGARVWCVHGCVWLRVVAVALLLLCALCTRYKLCGCVTLDSLQCGRGASARGDWSGGGACLAASTLPRAASWQAH